YALCVPPGLVADWWGAYFNYIRTGSEVWNASQIVGATLTGVVNSIPQAEPQLDAEVEEALRGLRAFIAQLRGGVVPDAPEPVQELAERVARSAREKPADVDDWARRLAGDVADATD